MSEKFKLKLSLNIFEFTNWKKIGGLTNNKTS